MKINLIIKLNDIGINFEPNVKKDLTDQEMAEHWLAGLDLGDLHHQVVDVNTGDILGEISVGLDNTITIEKLDVE